MGQGTCKRNWFGSNFQTRGKLLIIKKYTIKYSSILFWPSDWILASPQDETRLTCDVYPYAIWSGLNSHGGDLSTLATNQTPKAIKVYINFSLKWIMEFVFVLYREKREDQTRPYQGLSKKGGRVCEETEKCLAETWGSLWLWLSRHHLGTLFGTPLSLSLSLSLKSLSLRFCLYFSFSAFWEFFRTLIFLSSGVHEKRSFCHRCLFLNLSWIGFDVVHFYFGVILVWKIWLFDWFSSFQVELAD